MAALAIRQAAAQAVSGAPKIVGQRQQRATPGAAPVRPPGMGKTGAPTAAPKIHVGITEHQATPSAKPVGQHQAIREAAAHKAGGRPPKGPPAAVGKPAAQGLNPINEYDTGRYASPGEIAQIAQRTAQREAATDLTPLRQQATETGSAEQNALARNAAMGASGQQTLAGLQAGEEASAKTGENNAAEAAIQAANTIRSAGAAGATANGGYGGPQAAAALAEAGQQAGSLGAAASQYQSAMGLSGQNEMAAIRAAAAQRITEGGTRLQEGYGVAQARNAGEQDKILAKQGVDTERNDKLLGEEQTKDRSALAAVGVKEGTLKADVAKNNQTARIDTEKNQIAGRNDTEKNAATREKTQAQLKAGEVKNANSIRTAEIKAKAALEVANKKAGLLTTHEQDKVIGELGSAFTTFRELREKNLSPEEIRKALNTGTRAVTLEGQNKPTKSKVSIVKNQVLVRAAEELWNYHKVSPATKTALRAQGIDADALNLWGAVRE